MSNISNNMSIMAWIKFFIVIKKVIAHNFIAHIYAYLVVKIFILSNILDNFYFIFITKKPKIVFLKQNHRHCIEKKNM